MAIDRVVQVQVGFRLEQLDALKTESHRRHISVAKVVRDAVERYFALTEEERDTTPDDDRQMTIDDAITPKKRAKKGARK